MLFSFYQKIWTLIALAVIGVVFAIAFVCITAPYTMYFGFSLGAIVLANILLFGSWIRVLGAKDKNLPYNMGHVYPWLLYLVFTLLMIIVAVHEIKLSYFILIHSIGLVFALIFSLIFTMGEHNILVLDKKLAAEHAPKVHLKNLTADLRDLILEKCPRNMDMQKTAEKIYDMGVYAPNSISGSEEYDDKIQDIIEELSEAISSGLSPEEIKLKAKTLGRAFARRSNFIKEMR